MCRLKGRVRMDLSDNNHGKVDLNCMDIHIMIYAPIQAQFGAQCGCDGATAHTIRSFTGRRSGKRLTGLRCPAWWLAILGMEPLVFLPHTNYHCFLIKLIEPLGRLPRRSKFSEPLCELDWKQVWVQAHHQPSPHPAIRWLITTGSSQRHANESTIPAAPQACMKPSSSPLPALSRGLWGPWAS